MPLLTLQDAELAYGDFPLLDRASFSLEAGERIGLIGRNGTGKSSLLGVIAGRIALDDGELRRRDGLSVVLVEQEPALPERATLEESLLARAAASLRLALALQQGGEVARGGRTVGPTSPREGRAAVGWWSFPGVRVGW